MALCYGVTLVKFLILITELSSRSGVRARGSGLGAEVILAVAVQTGHAA